MRKRSGQMEMSTLAKLIIVIVVMAVVILFFTGGFSEIGKEKFTQVANKSTPNTDTNVSGTLDKIGGWFGE